MSRIYTMLRYVQVPFNTSSENEQENERNVSPKKIRTRKMKENE